MNWKTATLGDLWEAARPGTATFDPDGCAGVPTPARRYLTHAIAPGTRLASAVWLTMHGEIKLGTWRRFRAEQVISRERGMIWRATVPMFGLPVKGSDRLVDGHGALDWRLLGLVPVVRAEGPDVDRSAAGRVAAESIWLPSALCDERVSWSETTPPTARASVALAGETVAVDLMLDGAGALASVELQRWGNPDGGAFRYETFGAAVEAEATFDGYTIPSRVRVGWYFGTPRFDEGEFFRATLDAARFR